jgi:hypothetical protein
MRFESNYVHTLMFALDVSGYPENKNNHRRTRCAVSQRRGTDVHKKTKQESRPASMVCKGGPHSARVPLRQRSVPQDIDEVNVVKREGEE